MGEYDLLLPETQGQGWTAKLGMTLSKEDIFPTLNITGWYELQPGTHANYKENLFDMSDVVTSIKGRHVLHLGTEILVERADSTAWGNINAANLGFTDVYTAGTNNGTLATTTGSPYADFLLGYAKNWSASFTPEYGGRLKSPAAFVQDDVKVTPKLTANLGLRYFGTTAWSEVHGNQRDFDQTIINPATNAGGGNLRQYHAIAIDVGDHDGLRTDTAKLHEVLDKYGIANGFELYSGTHTSAVADRFQNHVMPFCSRNLCFTAGCR